MKNIFRQYFFILLLFFATVLLGLNYLYRPFYSETADQQQQQETYTQVEETNTQKDPDVILSQLTSEEKVLQMVAQPVILNLEFDSETDLEETAVATLSASGDSKEPEERVDVETIQGDSQMATLGGSPGLFTLFGKSISYSQAEDIILQLEESNTVASLPPLIMVDHEGGKVQRLSGEGFSRVPSWKTLCAVDTQERQSILRQSANELRSVGIDIVLAPVLDVGDNRVLTDRICSTDSYAIVADRAMEYVTIFEEFGILSVVKHFPGIGKTTKDLHTAYDAIEVLENDVKLYRYVIDQVSLIGVMVSHAGVISQDAHLPCSMSEYCVGELVAVYPEVLVVSDALEMNAASYDKRNPRVPKTLAEVSRDAIWAGNDVLLYGADVSESELASVVSQLTREYDANEDFKTLVDSSVKKIIEYKHALK